MGEPSKNESDRRPGPTSIEDGHLWVELGVEIKSSEEASGVELHVFAVLETLGQTAFLVDPNKSATARAQTHCNWVRKHFFGRL